MRNRIRSIRPQDIYPLTDFLRNHRPALERLKDTGLPEVLTVHGKGVVVIQDAEAFQQMHELAEEMEALISLQEGLDSIDQGEGLPLDEFKRRFRQKHPLPDTP